MAKNLVTLPLIILILIGCSSGDSTVPDDSSTQAITDDSITESNTESSTSLVTQSPSRETVLAVNRCIDSSDSAIYALDFFFSFGEISASDTVEEEFKVATEDCEEAALQVKTDGIKPLIASTDDFLFALRFAYADVLLVGLDLLVGKIPTWDQSKTTAVSDAAELFLQSVSEYGIAPS
jgi:hypothetical protein